MLNTLSSGVFTGAVAAQLLTKRKEMLHLTIGGWSWNRHLDVRKGTQLIQRWEITRDDGSFPYSFATFASTFVRLIEINLQDDTRRLTLALLNQNQLTANKHWLTLTSRYSLLASAPLRLRSCRYETNKRYDRRALTAAGTASPNVA